MCYYKMLLLLLYLMETVSSYDYFLIRQHNNFYCYIMLFFRLYFVFLDFLFRFKPTWLLLLYNTCKPMTRCWFHVTTHLALVTIWQYHYEFTTFCGISELDFGFAHSVTNASFCYWELPPLNVRQLLEIDTCSVSQLIKSSLVSLKSNYCNLKSFKILD